MKIIDKSGKKEQFTNPVPQLLDALKNLLLLEKDFNENSIPQVYRCLKSFLLELEVEMEEERRLASMEHWARGEGKPEFSLNKKNNQNPQTNGNQAELSNQPCDFEKKLRTVQSMYRRSRTRSRTRSEYRIDRTIPLILLSGLWLADYGFGIGARFLVYAEEDRLILKKEKNIVRPARKHTPSKVLPAALDVPYD
jgi:hypothetical protein